MLAFTGHSTEPNQGDVPVPGYYAIRLVRKGPQVAAQILFQDGLWSAVINGDLQGEPNADPVQARGIYRILPYGRPIDKARYDYLLALKEWAVTNDPSHPAANPNSPVDIADLKPFWNPKK